MFSRRLLELREKVGLSQKELSARLNMARTTYSGYENGSREPDHETLKRIADYFDVSTDYLLSRTDKPKQILNPAVRTLIDSLDLTDDEIIKKIKMEVDGMVLDEDDVRRFVAFVRLERAMKKQVPVSEQSKQ